MEILPSKVEYVDHMGSDLSVVDAARVSFNKRSAFEPDGQLSIKDGNLIRYLAKHNHWSPFAHTSVKIRVATSIVVARQLVKHQVGGVWNEVSRRYVDDNLTFYVPDEWRGRPVNSKQGSSDSIIDLSVEPLDPKNPGHISVHDAIQDNLAYAVRLYDRLIEIGVAPEQARFVLPHHLMTSWIWTGSLMFFARVCNLRMDPHAQKETRDVASQIDAIIRPLFPVSWDVLTYYGGEQ